MASMLRRLGCLQSAVNLRVSSPFAQKAVSGHVGGSVLVVVAKQNSEYT
jgi:hypothetical protein